MTPPHAPRPGVYRVTHRPSGRTLLGVSADASASLNRVRFELQHALHRAPALQRDWKQDGPAAFTFEVLDSLQPTDAGAPSHADLKELLALWLENLNLPSHQRY
ncbi:GIY-YIG nuclease family protein [Deinococcus taeanensis]|uniref:GIY-YIG nuclease family protein n=1 Tax=Deinococcus taeanensis TaxID=2737050 RepID=UPI001CDC1F7E|nr:GIY-YIG nuclease family protein [Deinococcus taeanensis]UBV41916.1 GIY-YIG nuclease family protein [Deinococcus taeanensis]